MVRAIKKSVTVLYKHFEEIFRLLKNKHFQFCRKQKHFVLCICFIISLAFFRSDVSANDTHRNKDFYLLNVRLHTLL